MKATGLLLAWATSAVAVLPAPVKVQATDREFPGVPLTPAEVVQNLDLLQDGELGALVGIPEYTLKMPVDHLNRSLNAAKYDHRYWVNDKFHKPGGPIIFVDFGQKTVTSNRVALEMGDPPSSKWRSAAVRLAEDLSGMIVGMEHRYYGKSLPVPLENGVPVDGMDAYKYLTLEQSLQDVVYFARTHFPEVLLNNTVRLRNQPLLQRRHERHPDYVPWFWIGGGYAGFRGAALREQYPKIIQGVWASSTPVRYQPYASALDNVMYRALPISCAEDIRAAMQHLDQILTSTTPYNLTSFSREDVRLMTYMTTFADIPDDPTPEFIANVFASYKKGGDYQVLTHLWAPLVNRFRKQGTEYLDSFCHEFHSFNTDQFLSSLSPYSERVFPGDREKTQLRQLPKDKRRYMRAISFLHGAPGYVNIDEFTSSNRFATHSMSATYGLDTTLAAFVFATWRLNSAQPEREKPPKVYVTSSNKYRIGNQVFQVKGDLFSPIDPVADLLAYSYQSYTQFGMIPDVDTESEYALGPPNLVKNHNLHNILQNNIQTVLKVQYNYKSEQNANLQKGKFLLPDAAQHPPNTTIPNLFGGWDFNPSNTMWTVGEFSYLYPYALGSVDIDESINDGNPWTDAAYNPTIPPCNVPPTVDNSDPYRDPNSADRVIFGFWHEGKGTYTDLFGEQTEYSDRGRRKKRYEPDEFERSYITFRNAVRKWSACFEQEKNFEGVPE